VRIESTQIKSITSKFGMDRINPSTAIIREHTQSFGLGCPSASVKIIRAV